MAVLQPLAAEGQSRGISFDARGAYSVPFGDFGDRVDSDFGFGLSGTVDLAGPLGIYAGWGQDAFGCELCSDEDKVTSSGFEGGLSVRGGSSGPVIPWARAGVVWHQVSFDAGPVQFESDRKLGLQAAGGLEFPLGQVLSVTSGVRVHFLDMDDLEDGDFFEDSEVRYFSVDIGARIRVPR